ncbi:MAG: hypothetical protein ACOYOQ_14655 [Microthrixaceae bacterium]
MTWYGVFNVLGWVVGVIVIGTGSACLCLLIGWLIGAVLGRFRYWQDAADRWTGSFRDGSHEVLVSHGPLAPYVMVVRYRHVVARWLRRFLVLFGVSAALFVAGSIVFENFVR